ncbi:MAG: GFA family protein [Oleibacter sp.]|nr:GFA family protein [Thalassolituus sp.]
MSKVLQGSCLCGSVAYEVKGQAKAFYHCHCGRCRKANGSGHASNILVSPESYQWTRGEELIRMYKVPEAERFANFFCSLCGSPLPKVREEQGVVVIQAGTLDTIPEITPEAHIFWDSRAEWECENVSLPTFEKYPN